MLREKQEPNKIIACYYDYTLPFYRFFWHKNTNAIHYGFWEKGIKSHEESLLNSNRFMAEKAKIKKGDLVLDAGCGVGGSSIWIAKNYGVHVVGITISVKQLEKAKELAKQNKVEHLVKFYLRDYLKTEFENETFDVVWGQESVCHAIDKFNFLKESYRVLKNNGRVIIADGFKKREPQNQKETKVYIDFLEGLSLPSLDTFNQFRASLERSGFRNIQLWDKSKEILPSSRRMFKMCKFGYLFAKLTEKLRLTPKLLTKNNLAGIVQYEAMKIGLGCYGVFYGEKLSI